jgi:hypothetical protein
MKITSANHEPEKYGPLWWGTAIDGDAKFEWFYTPRSRFDMRVEERPGMWVNIRDPRPGDKRAVLKAIKVSKAS